MELNIKKFLNIDFFKQNPEFTKLFIGQFISNFGDWFHFVAILMLIYNLTGSNLSFGITIILFFLPSIIFQSFCGYIIDRFNKKSILLLIDIVRFCLIILLLIFYRSFGVYYVCIIIFLKNLVASLYIPTRSAIVPELVSYKKTIGNANSLLSFAYHFTLIFSPAIGGLLLNKIGIDLVLLIDACTFLISFLCIFSMKLKKHEIFFIEKQKSEKIWENLFIGFKEIISSRISLKMITLTAFWQIGYGIINFLSPVLIIEYFKEGEKGLGYRYSIVGIGCVIGIFLTRCFLSKILSKERYVDYALIYGSIFAGITVIFMFIQKNFYFFLIFLLINAIIINPLEIITESYLLIKSKDHVRGRIVALFYFGISVCMIYGIINGMIFRNLGSLLGIISGMILILSSMIVLLLNSSKTDVFEEKI